MRRALQESEDRFRTLFEQAGEAIFLYSMAENRFIAANEAFLQMHGYTASEVATMTLRDINPALLPDVHNERLAKMIAEKSIVFEVEHRHKKGHVLSLEVSANLIDLKGQKCILAFHRDISQRKKSDLALRRSEERFRSLLDSAPIAISIVNSDGRIEYLNRKHVEIMGYDLNDIPTLEKWWTLAYPDEEERARVGNAWKEIKTKAFQGEEVRAVDRTVVCKDGTARHVALSFRAAEDRIIAAFADITERKESEEKLRKSELYYRTLFEKASEGIIFINESGVILSVNEAFAQMHGYHRGEILRMHINDLDVRKQFGTEPERFNSGETIRFEVEHFNSEGHVFPLEVSVTLMTFNDDRYFVAFHRDISERKKADVALRESEERYRRLLSSVTDYIYSTRIEGGLPCETSHGESCIAVTGYTPEHYHADPDLWLRMVVEDDREAVLLQARKALFGEKTPPLEHRIIHRDGSIRWIRNTLVPRLNGESVLVAIDGLIVDMTEKKLLEEKLEKIRLEKEENLTMFSRQLIEVQEEERRSIARELHDEIGQALTGMKLFVENLELTLMPDQADTLKTLEMSLGELLHTVRNMSLDLRPTMLDDFGLVSTFRWYLERYELQTGITVDFRHTKADRRLGRRKEIALYRIMQEALANAARYSGVRSISVDLFGSLDTMTLSIVDRGRGFSMDIAMKPSASGLSIMRERTLMEGGSFFIKSVPGGGTEIAASIPI